MLSGPWTQVICTVNTFQNPKTILCIGSHKIHFYVLLGNDLSDALSETQAHVLESTSRVTVCCNSSRAGEARAPQNTTEQIFMKLGTMIT